MATTPRATTIGVMLAVLALVAVVLVVIATGTGPGDADDRPTIAVVGDSITDQSGPALDRALDGWRTSIVGVSGALVGDLVPQVSDAVASEPDALVIELGINDAAASVGDEEPVAAATRAAIQSVVRALRGQRCAVWIFPALRPGLRLFGRDDALTVDERLDRVQAEVRRVAAEERVAVRVVDMARTDPEYVDELDADGVHPRPPGQARYAERVRALADDCR